MAGKALVNQIEEALGISFDPAPAYLFSVSVSGLVVGLFTACEGLEVKRQIEELREGGVNDHVHMLPGRVSLGRVRLKRGITVSRVLWDWFNDGLYSMKVRRLNMSIVQGAPGMNAIPGVSTGIGIVKAWNLDDAYPESWSLSSLDANNTTQVAVESLELVCSSISLAPLVGTPMSPMALLE